MMRYHANGIDYELEEDWIDGWINVYEIHPETHERIPKIRARDMMHAQSYCNFTERINVPFNVL